MLLRLAYLAVTNAFAMLRLLPMSHRERDVEILALRHQITVLERQLGQDRVRFTPRDRVFLAALLHRLPRDALRRLRLLMRPDTVLRPHRDLVARRHAARSRPKRSGRAGHQRAWLLRNLGERGELDAPTAATVLEVAQRVSYRARIPEALANAFRRALPADASELLARKLEPDTIPGWDRKRLDGIEAVEAELRALSRFPSHA